MVYAREIDGETLTFGDAGKVLRNALVVYDHQTQSHWSQFIGEACLLYTDDAADAIL